MAIDGPALVRETKDELLRYVSFTDPLFADLCAIWIALTYLSPNLRSIFYLGIQGPKGTGKTTLLEVLSELAWNPKMRSKPSESVTARDSFGHTLFMDEIDELREETREAVYGVLRQGYRRGGIYARTDVKTMATVETPVYGPKSFTFRGNVEDALRDRTFPVSMQKAEDTVVYTLRNKTRDLSKLRKKWEAWGKSAARSWTLKKFDALLSEESFQTALRTIVGPTGSPRDAETVIDLLLAGSALGLPPETLLSLGSFCRSYRESLDSTDELVMLGYVLSVMAANKDNAAAGYIRSEAVRTVFNLRRADVGDKAVGPYVFRRILRDYGLRDKDDVDRLPKTKDIPDRPTVIYLNGKVLSKLPPFNPADVRDEPDA